MEEPDPLDGLSFPRRQARTRRFSLGTPRSFAVSPDGVRVVYLQSRGPVDPINCLWVRSVDQAQPRLVVAPDELTATESDLTSEERARRERARETGGGIVSFDCDEDRSRATFSVGGEIHVTDLTDGETSAMPSAPSAFDPRLAPDGSRVAYVAERSLHVVDSSGDRRLVGEDQHGVTWGLAEFVAAEEMGRTRGFWWAPDSTRLLAARVDESGVERWWIGTPVDPSVEPQPVRYPAAGTSNASVELAVVDLDGRRVAVDWAKDGWEYLADASWTVDGLIVVVQTRDQRTLAVLDIDPDTGECSERYRIDDDRWVDLVPGAPCLRGRRLITVEDRGSARRLCVDGESLTGDDLQVRRVVRVSDDGVHVTASTDPTEVHVARVDWSGELEWITREPGVHSAAVGGSTIVVCSRSLAREGVSTTILARGEPVGSIVDRAAPTGLEHRVELTRTGNRRLATAVLYPAGGEPAGPLPVLLDPYGGPHAQRVQRARSAFDTSQWFADQGFAVVVIDGRGTPGRGPEFERAVRGDLASAVLEDQIDGLDELAAADDRLDLTRVAVRGWSFGGYLAALAVLRAPDVFHAAIAGAPVTDWRLYDTHYTERYLGHPSDEPEGYERSSIVGEASALERPLMLIHGLADDNVFVAHSLALSRALLEAGRPHTVLPLSDVTHLAGQEEVAENLLLMQLAFLRDSLDLREPGPAQPPDC